MATETFAQLTAGSVLNYADLIPIWQGSPTTGAAKQISATTFAALMDAGRPGGKTISGGTAAGDSLVLRASGALGPTGTIDLIGNAQAALRVHADTGTVDIANTLSVGGVSNLFGNITTAGSLTANAVVATTTGTFQGGRTIVGPGVQSSGGFGGLTFTGSELGTVVLGVGTNSASCLDLRGGRCDNAGNPVLNVAGDTVARLMYAGSTAKPSQPKVGVACINVVASENWTADGTLTPTATGSQMEFYVNPNGTTTNHGIPNSGPIVPAMKLGNDASLTVNGNLAIGGTSSLFGNVSSAGTVTAAGHFLTSSVVGFNATTAIFPPTTIAGNLAATNFTVNSGPQILAGSGAPSASAPNGSIYLNSDTGSASTRLYVRAAGAWTAVTVP